jgi:hypothetical protein
MLEGAFDSPAVFVFLIVFLAAMSVFLGAG